MAENDSKIKTQTQSKLVKWGIIAAALLVVFLLGLVPMLMQKWGVQEELAKTETALRKVQIENLLTTSIVEANRGEYERARQNAEKFFQELRAEEEKADKGYLSEEARGKLKSIFDASYQVIALLAKGDQASVERLNNIYSSYQEALGNKQPPTTVPPKENNANATEKPAEEKEEKSAQ